MTDPLFDAGDGTTPIDDDEAAGLLPSWIRTRSDLNEAERNNILEARRIVQSVKLDDVLDDLWLRRLHGRMFGKVWSWAGRYRTTEKSIGIDPSRIATAVRSLANDCRCWVEQDDAELTVARFHHRLVAIHPFPNGNGRHAHAMADYLTAALGMAPPTWGAKSGLDGADLRRAYVAALRTADRDRDDLEALIEFIGS